MADIDETPRAEDLVDSLAFATAIGIPASRIHIIDHLRTVPEATITEIGGAIGMTRSALGPHLDRLLALGIVEVRVVRSTRPGRPTRHYRLDGSRAEDFAWRVYDALAPRPA